MFVNIFANMIININKNSFCLQLNKANNDKTMYNQ